MDSRACCVYGQDRIAREISSCYICVYCEHLLATWTTSAEATYTIDTEKTATHTLSAE